MSLYRIVSVIIFGLCAASCTSDPYAQVNQNFPIRQMDHFFDELSGPQAVPTVQDYTHHPGYAPAYPPY